MIKLKMAIAIVAGFFFATSTILSMVYGPTGPTQQDMRNNLVAWTAMQQLKPVQRINRTGKGDRYEIQNQDDATSVHAQNERRKVP